MVGGTPLVLSHVVMTAEIVKVGGAWVLQNGTFGGRIAANNYLAGASGLPDAVEGGVLCKGSPGYQLALRTTCGFVDIDYEGIDDDSKECDAVSIGWRFADSAPISLVGATAPQPPEPSLCEAGASLADDSCFDLEQ
jgi:hypothetical protein